MTGNLPEDRAGQSEEGGVEAAQDVPVQTPEVDQGVGQSSSVLLPEEVLRRTFGDRTELLNLVRSLQTLAGLPVEGADGDDEGGGDVSQENYVSAGEGEQIPPGLLSSGVSARPQGTPDFPHRVEEPPAPDLSAKGPSRAIVWARDGGSVGTTGERSATLVWSLLHARVASSGAEI